MAKTQVVIVFPDADVKVFATESLAHSKVAPMCPKCGAPECHPTEDHQLLVRGYKVHDNGHWWSQCLVCNGSYDKNLVFSQERYNANSEKGWF